jgi:zinc D-Ala-D-Ala carboxypeptidase
LNWAVAPTTYHRIAVDGDFGPDTAGKVTKFQQCYNDRVDPNIGVDGRVGSETAPKLETWAGSTQYVC